MRIGGITVNGPRESTLPLPFGDDVILFRAVGIRDYDEFNSLCPPPEPPVVVTSEGSKKNYDNENYRKELGVHNQRRSAYMVIKSLEPSDIEWETVRLDEPRTWLSYENDFKNAGFNIHQINRIVDLVAEANCLSEEKMEWARQVFQRGRLEQHSLTPSQPTEQATSPSGEPVSE